GIRASTAVITAANIISNAADRGGGIFVTSAASGLVINNATFVQNKAVAGDGGSIYASGPITLGGRFISMTVSNQSPAMTIGGGYSELEVWYQLGIARGCVAGQFGGAAYSPLTVTITCGSGCGNVYSQNRAGVAGGVAFANFVRVSDAQFVSNTAPVGGALVA